MPIYDYDGTTTYAIGNVYDYDGTTTYKLVRGYDYDGTTSSLIYSSEEPIYTNGTQNYELTVTEIDRKEAYVTFNSDNFYIFAKGNYGTGGSHISALTTEKIDVTNYSTLHFIANGSASEFSTDNAFYGVLCTGDIGSNPFNHNAGVVNLSGTNGEETTLDISDITGSYHIGVGVNAYRINDASNSGYVYKIWLD